MHGSEVSGQIRNKLASLKIHLEKNKDILGVISSKYPSAFHIGFAAETNDVDINAKAKLLSKKIDMIISNDVSNKLWRSTTNLSLNTFSDKLVKTSSPGRMVAKLFPLRLKITFPSTPTHLKPPLGSKLIKQEPAPDKRIEASGPCRGAMMNFLVSLP
mgnify:CR=1 FL=1